MEANEDVNPPASVEQAETKLADLPLHVYVDSIDRTSQRVRWITLVMVIACVLSFTAFWNSLPDGWLLSRIRLAQNARTFLLASDADRDRLLLSTRAEEFQNARDWAILFGFLEDVEVSSARVRDPVTLQGIVFRGSVPGSPAPSATVVKHADSTTTGISPFVGPSASDMLMTGRGESAPLSLRFSDLTPDRMGVLELQSLLDELMRSRVRDVIMLDVPFLGVHFDINDLGVFSGFSFLVLLALLRLNLVREHRAIIVCFAVARRHKLLDQMFYLVAMSQVLVVPGLHQSRHRRIDDEKTSPEEMPPMNKLIDASGPHPVRYFWRLAPATMILLPLAVQVCVFLNDLSTQQYGKVVSSKYMVASMMLSFVFLLGIMGLSAECLHCWRRINREWDRVCAELKI